VQLHRDTQFDVVQLITYTTWRVGCPLWKLGIPFIWGPISGTEIFPMKFLPLLSPVSQAFEIFRAFSTWRSQRSRNVRECAKNATHIIAIHEQARSFLSRLRGADDGISVHSGWFFEDEHIAALGGPRSFSTGSAPLRMVAAGNLEGRKGIALALHALRKVTDAGVPFYYQITSKGPELAHLRRLADKLGIGDSVVLGEAFPREELVDRLREFDICLLPSLREGGGLTMMEASIARCVPIVAACGGPGDSVSAEFGFPIPVQKPQQMIEAIADAVLLLHRDRELLAKMAIAAGHAMQQRSSRARFQEMISGTYAAVVSTEPPSEQP
jgi:glycosyltransferase involved in cell wall biosynthesis